MSSSKRLTKSTKISDFMVTFVSIIIFKLLNDLVFVHSINLHDTDKKMQELVEYFCFYIYLFRPPAVIIPTPFRETFVELIKKN